MSNTDVKNDNVRLIRLVQRLEQQRDYLLAVLELVERDCPDSEVLDYVRAALAKVEGQS